MAAGLQVPGGSGEVGIWVKTFLPHLLAAAQSGQVWDLSEEAASRVTCSKVGKWLTASPVGWSKEIGNQVHWALSVASSEHAWLSHIPSHLSFPSNNIQLHSASAALKAAQDGLPSTSDRNSEARWQGVNDFALVAWQFCCRPWELQPGLRTPGCQALGKPWSSSM